MIRHFGMMMSLLAGSVLALPQGWCCLLLAMTGSPRTEAKVVEPAPAPCRCCQTKAEHKANDADQKSTTPARPNKCNLCVSATQMPPVKVTGDEFLPAAVSLLAAPVLVSVPSSILEDVIPVLETGPPRHEFLCVWRC